MKTPFPQRSHYVRPPTPPASPSPATHSHLDPHLRPPGRGHGAISEGATATPTIIGVTEPATLAALVGLAGFAIRRRKA